MERSQDPPKEESKNEIKWSGLWIAFFYQRHSCKIIGLVVTGLQPQERYS
jgi:hypothetical protein